MPRSEMTFRAKGPVFPMRPVWLRAAVGFQGRNLPAAWVLVASRARSSAAKGVVRKVGTPVATGEGTEVVTTAVKATATEEETEAVMTAVSSVGKAVPKC